MASCTSSPAPARHDAMIGSAGNAGSTSSTVNAPLSMRSRTSTVGNAPTPKPSPTKRVMAATELTQFTRGDSTPLRCSRLSMS